jgi:hypothetical protein
MARLNSIAALRSVELGGERVLQPHPRYAHRTRGAWVVHHFDFPA